MKEHVTPRSHDFAIQVSLGGENPSWERFRQAEKLDAYDEDLQRSNRQRLGSDEHYPESIAKPHTSYVREGFDGRYEVACPGYAKIGEDSNQHIFAKEIVCGREWCSYCGGTDGLAHSRRKARWYPKGRQIDCMGYFVVTVPPEIRRWYRTKTALSRLGIAFRRMFKRHGFERGLSGWDYFGEAENAPDGKSPKWHPHFSAIVDGRWLSPKALNAIKASVGRILKVKVERVNVYYRFSNDPLMKLHWLNYVSRPTFLDYRWDTQMAIELRGFRTYQAWGARSQWTGELAWDLPEGEEREAVGLEGVEAGNCSECGEKIIWQTGVIDAVKLIEPGWRSVGGGYWRFAGVSPPVQLGNQKPACEGRGRKGNKNDST